VTPGRNCTLVIMAKAPRPGRVKTRLAPTLPVPAIIDLYSCLLADTLALAQSLDGVETAIMSPASDIEELSRVTGGSVSVIGQTGDGLGAALASVFGHFAAAGSRRVVAFNSDSPHLPAAALLNAFDALNSCDLVIGPTDDGGYYLAGANASHPGLFEGGPLGTANALEALLARARCLDLSVRFTEPFYDVDVAADLSRLADDLLLAPERAPRTARWLAGWTLTTPQKRTDGAGL
jgi:rSAM/selenodomain-associated transferase 1